MIYKQYIHCKVSYGTYSMLCSFIYGSYLPNEIVELWDGLMQFSQNVRCSWIVLWDFNAVMSNRDRIGGMDVDETAASEFKNCIIDSNLLELKFNGIDFTWSNNQSGHDRIWRKLDWCFVNDYWMEEWTESYCEKRSPGISDHPPQSLFI
ncbi:uncharacterized protein LOC126687744 [Mercurialis annua]|uniref:uncharacterized protein LOC126687744 n=1 Tax=Mercurialis annua TaxID=3986 RepID=UPI00215FC839|nr:uncharacterized protein LOC126687744 [Mercurialis annua]